MSYVEIQLDRIEWARDEGKITEREAELMDQVMADANTEVDALRV